MFTLRIEHNIDKIIEDLKELERQLRDLTRFWQSFSLPYLIQEVEGIFDSEPWAPLSYPYVLEKAQSFPGQGILRRTDTLYDSFTQENAPYSVQDARPDRFTYGTDVPYGFFHEFGITPPENWGDLPKRSVFENLPGDLDNEIGERLESYIDALVGEFDLG